MEEKTELNRELKTAIYAAIAGVLIAIIAATGLMYWVQQPPMISIVGYAMTACIQTFFYVMLADQLNQVKKNG